MGQRSRSDFSRSERDEQQHLGALPVGTGLPRDPPRRPDGRDEPATARAGGHTAHPQVLGPQLEAHRSGEGVSE